MGYKGMAAILEVIRLDRKLRWALEEWPTRAELRKLLKALRIRTIEERAVRALREGWICFPEAENLIR
jgi:type II secretory ATPase GspE/PulE/Tfp pilus assembly ATPase PilB-like protein